MKSLSASQRGADGGTTMVFDASGLTGDDEIYKRNAVLTRNFSIKLFEPGNEATNFKRFSIVSASYDPGTDRLIAVTAGGLNTFNPPGGVEVSLVPHFFRMVTNDVVDSYPPGTEVRVLFDATRADAQGMPSENPATVHGFTADISELNDESWDFFRFRVEFDLGSGVSQSTPRPALQFLRVPFEY